jgi:type IV pilus assembly protein PilM
VLADLVGLATRLVVKDEPEASLLPPALTEAVAFRKRQPTLVAAAALLTLALLPPIFYLHRLASAALARVAQVESQLMPLRAIQTRNTENLAKIEDAKKQIAALLGAVETKSNWINFFTDIQTRLVKVEDVWLDKLQIVRPPLSDLPAPDAAAADPAAKPAGARSSSPSAAGCSMWPTRSPSVSPEARERVKQLLASFAGSQFIASVENEKFDNNQNGLLRFDFTLVINPKHPL